MTFLSLFILDQWRILEIKSNFIAFFHKTLSSKVISLTWFDNAMFFLLRRSARFFLIRKVFEDGFEWNTGKESMATAAFTLSPFKRMYYLVKLEFLIRFN
jgi:hypothetical protein